MTYREHLHASDIGIRGEQSTWYNLLVICKINISIMIILSYYVNQAQTYPVNHGVFKYARHQGMWKV